MASSSTAGKKKKPKRKVGALSFDMDDEPAEDSPAPKAAKADEAPAPAAAPASAEAAPPD